MPSVIPFPALNRAPCLTAKPRRAAFSQCLRRGFLAPVFEVWIARVQIANNLMRGVIPHQRPGAEEIHA